MLHNESDDQALQTTRSLYQYTLRGYYDPSSPVDGLLYENTALGNCSVQLIELKQYLWSPAEDQVTCTVSQTNV